MLRNIVWYLFEVPISLYWAYTVAYYIKSWISFDVETLQFYIVVLCINHILFFFIWLQHYYLINNKNNQKLSCLEIVQSSHICKWLSLRIILCVFKNFTLLTFMELVLKIPTIFLTMTGAITKSSSHDVWFRLGEALSGLLFRFH